MSVADQLDDRRSAPPLHAPDSRIKCALHGIPSRTYPQPESHRLIHQFEWHFMICIRTAPLNMADHDTTWGLT